VSTRADQALEFLQGVILIVDDTPANLLLLSQLLAQHGYETRAANSGVHALAAIQASPPDLILLDIMMPEMSGYEVCEQLKADEQTRDIPVVFLSALDSTEDKVQAFTVGGVDYITKPFQAQEVLARVQTHLALRNLQKNLQQKILERDKLIAELDAYAHTVAHDLKNPLSVIVGFIRLLQDGGEMSGPEPQEILERIEQGGLKMQNIIDELLLLSSVREMTEDIIQPLDMAHVVAEATKRMAHLTRQHQADVILPPDKNWPAVLGYGPWVEEVWINYISNALKYGGKPPRIELGFGEWANQRISESAPTRPLAYSPTRSFADSHIRFWVRDNGPGLSSEEQERLFTPFERLHQARAEGHGLGLSIVQRIIGKLGGQVGVESQTGQGSMFWFSLPDAR
jgi:two-component system sensor histidine kinase/response regulator